MQQLNIQISQSNMSIWTRWKLFFLNVSVCLSRSNNIVNKSLAIEICSLCSLFNFISINLFIWLCKLHEIPLLTGNTFHLWHWISLTPTFIDFCWLGKKRRCWHDIIRTISIHAYLQDEFDWNRRIVHLIPLFDSIYRKALDCVNSTQKKCKWKQRWSSCLTFSSNELSFPGERRGEKKRGGGGDVIHHCIDLVSHPFLLPPSLPLLLNIYIQKKIR